MGGGGWGGGGVKCSSLRRKKLFWGLEGGRRVKALMALQLRKKLFLRLPLFKEYKYEIKNLFMSEKRQFFVHVTTI